MIFVFQLEARQWTSSPGPVANYEGRHIVSDDEDLPIYLPEQLTAHSLKLPSTRGYFEFFIES